MSNALDRAEATILAFAIDYRPIFIKDIRAIVAVEFSGQGLSDAEAEQIAAPELDVLLKAAEPYFLHNDIDHLNKLLGEFQSRLFARISAHNAQLRERNFQSELKRAIERDEFRPYGYGRAETLALEVLCTDDDHIVGIDFDGIAVERDGSRRAISRHEMIEVQMPSTSSYESWRRSGGFVSDGKIAELRNQAERKAFNLANPLTGRSILHADGTVTRA